MTEGHSTWGTDCLQLLLFSHQPWWVSKGVALLVAPDSGVTESNPKQIKMGHFQLFCKFKVNPWKQLGAKEEQNSTWAAVSIIRFNSGLICFNWPALYKFCFTHDRWHLTKSQGNHAKLPNMIRSLKTQELNFKVMLKTLVCQTKKN